MKKKKYVTLKQNVKALEIENKFLRNDVVSKQNLIDSLLEHNSNLLNRQCCGVIQGTQANVRSGINTDVTDNHSNNHEVNTNTMAKPIYKPPLIERTIKQQYIETTVIVA